MINGISSGLSALQAIQKKVDSTANNVANMDTDGFKKTKVTLNEGGAQQGVEASVRTVATPGPLVYEQTGLGKTLVEKSNVELSEELPSLMQSKRSLQANIKTMQTIDEMRGYLLDIKS